MELLASRHVFQSTVALTLAHLGGSKIPGPRLLDGSLSCFELFQLLKYCICSGGVSNDYYYYLDYIGFTMSYLKYAFLLLFIYNINLIIFY